MACDTGGTLLIFTPAFQFLWGHQDEISRRYRRYTSGELRSKLEDAGLHVEKLSYANMFLMPLVWSNGKLQGRRVWHFDRQTRRLVLYDQLNPKVREVRSSKGRSQSPPGARRFHRRAPLSSPRV